MIDMKNRYSLKRWHLVLIQIAATLFGIALGAGVLYAKAYIVAQAVRGTL
jgi:hypothetical protein